MKGQARLSHCRGLARQYFPSQSRDGNGCTGTKRWVQTALGMRVGGDLVQWGKERTVSIKCSVRDLTGEALGSWFASLFAELAEKPATCLNLKPGQQNT